MDLNQLSQLISKPTRISSGSVSLIDVIITATSQLFSKTGVLRNSLSDHFPIFGVIPFMKHYSKHRVIATRKWNEEKVLASQNDVKNVPWDDVERQSSIDGVVVETWSEFFTVSLNKHFSVKKKRLRQRTHPWINGSILKLMRQRDNFHKKAHKTGDDAHWSTYRMLRNQVTYNLRKYRRDYFKNKLEQNKNPKGFWKTLDYVLPGSKKKKSLNINEIVRRDQLVLTDPQQISNALNSDLTSVAANTLAEAYTKRTCNDEAVSTSLFDPDEDHKSEFNFRHLNNEEVYKALVNLNTTKASGADNIPAKALKVAADK